MYMQIDQDVMCHGSAVGDDYVYGLPEEEAGVSA
jgi:hypothetical protein